MVKAVGVYFMSCLETEKTHTEILKHRQMNWDQHSWSSVTGLVFFVLKTKRCSTKTRNMCLEDVRQTGWRYPEQITGNDSIPEKLGFVSNRLNCVGCLLTVSISIWTLYPNILPSLILS